jgi:hypothetical protein
MMSWGDLRRKAMGKIGKAAGFDNLHYPVNK